MPFRNAKDILQNNPIVNLLGCLPQKLRRRRAQHHPPLLEDAKIGRVTASAVACSVSKLLYRSRATLRATLRTIGVVGGHGIAGIESSVNASPTGQETYDSSMAMAMSMVFPQVDSREMIFYDDLETQNNQTSVSETPSSR